MTQDIKAKKKEGKTGELINKVYEADCLEMMKQIPNKSVDMILCDLPYGTTQNKWDSVIPLDKLWEQYERIIKDTGVIVLTAQGLFTAKLILSNEKFFKYKIVWEKSKSTNFLNAKKQPLRKHEDVCIFYKKQPTYHPQMRKGEPYNKGVRKDQLTGSYGNFKAVEVKSNGDRYPIDVVYFKTAESEGRVYHPTQKPVALFEYLIETYTDKGDLVLDNCAGSGTTGVACKNLSRNYILIEKEPKYIIAIKDRLTNLSKKAKRDKIIDTLFVARRRQGKSQKWVAERLGVSIMGVSHIERKNRDIRLRELVKLADILGYKLKLERK